MHMKPPGAPAWVTDPSKWPISAERNKDERTIMQKGVCLDSGFLNYWGPSNIFWQLVAVAGNNPKTMSQALYKALHMCQLI